MRAPARKPKGAARVQRRGAESKPAAARAGKETGSLTPLRRSPRPAQALTLARLPAARAGPVREAPPEVARAEKGPEGAKAPGVVGPLDVVAPEDATEEEARRVAAKVEAGEEVPPIQAMSPAASTLHRQEEGEPTVQEAGRGRPLSALARQAAQRQEPLEKQGLAAAARVMRAEGALDPGAVQTLARTAPGAAGPGLDTAAAAEAIARSGEGRSLAPDLQRVLEAQLRSDLGDVRVHDDAAAAQAAQALDARAFAIGPDIYLARGEDPGDTALMAHEVTHAIQQTGGTLARRPAPGDGAPAARARRLQRQFASRATNEGGEGDEAKPVVETTPKKRIRVPKVVVPKFKTEPVRGILGGAHEFYRFADYKRGSPGQVRLWEGQVSPAGTRDALRKLGFLDNHPYLIRAPKADARFNRIGDPAALAPGLVRPFWWRTGKFEEHHVDHIVELQTAGWSNQPVGNTIENLEMLSAKANMRSGDLVRRNLEAAIRAFLADKTKSDLLPDKNPSVAKIKAEYDVVIGKFENSNSSIADHSRYDKAEIEAGAHITALGALAEGAREIKFYDLENTAKSGIFSRINKRDFEEAVGSSDTFVVYRKSFGGSRLSFDFSKATGEATAKAKESVPRPEQKLWGLEIKRIEFDSDKKKPVVGALIGQVFKKQRDKGLIKSEEEDYRYPVKRVAGLAYAGALDAADFRAWVQDKLRLEGLSPIQVKDALVDDEKGLVVIGSVLPDVPLIARAQLDLILEGDELRLEKKFQVGDFDLPGPVHVTESDLAVSVGTRGLGVDGAVKFQIERVGEGELRGRGRSGLGEDGASLMLAGRFDFDSELFDPARIAMKYENKEFSGEGEIGIKRGKVRGIKSASARVTYAAGTLSATGTVEPDIKGVESGTLELTYSHAEGLVVAGTLNFGKDIPKVKGGSLSAKVERKPGEEGYKLSGSGRAELDIEGVDGAIEAAYDDGAFTLQGRVGYKKGLAEGEVTVGVSNRALDDAGQPTGEPGKDLLVFGKGLVTLTFTPWLKGTVGLELRPNGEIVVAGEVGLPASFEVFPQKKFEKNVFTIGLDIPIIGLSVAGKRIGIFANISGGLDIGARIGPGALRELAVGVIYNPAREDETRICGRALFAVPAQAGLRLFVRGSLGAGIPVVSAQAGLEIGGGLGLEGEARAGVEIDWTPATGLALAARGELFVEPTLKFDITGFVLVELDLWLKTIELYEKRWQLAGFELGSGLRFGIIFPVTYRQGEPFDISLDDVQFVVPQIEPWALLKNLIDQVV